ncbi:MAG: peptidoglycan DL-endopeptidase RipA [Pseudonocardiales bacterium]|nr:peptidoglycan DL-endopeptidase RipA [Pseudonocardiales bacterium]
MRLLRVHARRAAVVAALLVGAMVAGSGSALADPAPPPSPPPNPSDQQLDQSKSDINSAAGQVGKLTSQLAAVQAEADQLGFKLEGRQENANKALVDLQVAQDAAAQAARQAQATQVEATAAAGAIEEAHRQLDEFIAVAYEQGVQSGSFGLLMEADDPADLVQRAELTQAVADQEKAALEGMQRARVAKVNADSLARAAQLAAVAKQNAAVGAKKTADGAVASAQSALSAGLAQLRQVNVQRVSLEHQLDVLTAHDAGLRAQRQQYLSYQAQVAAAAKAAAAAAAARVAGAGAGVGAAVTAGARGVIDRALSQVGVTYAWGGGTARGPSRGIRDGGVADEFGDYRKTGFDCSGLMLYAFGALGIGLPHYSGYQYNAGKKVPISQMRPGDMLFWADGGTIHHVALFIGNGKMVEAPYSGGAVRIVPVRYGDGLMPNATRLLG